MNGVPFNQQPKPTGKEVPVRSISQTRFEEIQTLTGMPFMDAASEILGSEYSDMAASGIDDRRVYLAAIALRVMPTEKLVADFQAGLGNPREALNRNPDGEPGQIVADAERFSKEALLEDGSDPRSGYEQRRG